MQRKCRDLIPLFLRGGGKGGVKRSPGKARGVANADAAAREADPPAANGAAAALDGLSLSSDK